MSSVTAGQGKRGSAGALTVVDAEHHTLQLIADHNSGIWRRNRQACTRRRPPGQTPYRVAETRANGK